MYEDEQTRLRERAVAATAAMVAAAVAVTLDAVAVSMTTAAETIQFRLSDFTFNYRTFHFSFQGDWLVRGLIGRSACNPRWLLLSNLYQVSKDAGQFWMPMWRGRKKKGSMKEKGR